jgi:hypothetical protein
MPQNGKNLRLVPTAFHIQIFNHTHRGDAGTYHDPSKPSNQRSIYNCIQRGLDSPLLGAPTNLPDIFIPTKRKYGGRRRCQRWEARAAPAQQRDTLIRVRSRLHQLVHPQFFIPLVHLLLYLLFRPLPMPAACCPSLFTVTDRDVEIASSRRTIACWPRMRTSPCPWRPSRR